MFLLPSARSCPDFCTPLVQTPPTGKSDAASEMLKLGGASAAHAASTHLRSSRGGKHLCLRFVQQRFFPQLQGSHFKSRGEGSQIFWGCLAGCEVSFDVQLVVCMAESTQTFWIRFGGQQVSSM